MSQSENSSHEELIKQLRGVQRIAINTCYGGFGLSYQAKLLYLELAGIEHTLVPQPDRDRQNRYGHQFIVKDAVWSERDIPRDDPVLIGVLNRLGTSAWGDHASIKVVEIPAGVEWNIGDYDGREWVEEKHRTWS
jgi:hypothetical protein